MPMQYLDRAQDDTPNPFVILSGASHVFQTGSKPPSICIDSSRWNLSKVDPISCLLVAYDFSMGGQEICLPVSRRNTVSGNR